MKKIFFKLSVKSLMSQRGISFLIVFALAVATALIISVEKIRKGSEESFKNSISQTDLIVGARGGAMSLLLYSVFNIGSATNNISIESYEYWKNHGSVEWTFPYSLGDSHRGFRVVGTNEDFLKHFKYRGGQNLVIEKGQWFSGLWDVVIGAEVAKNLNYDLGQKISLTHGVTRGEGLLQHDDKPFQVVGVLSATGTTVDRSVFVSLESLEALHIDWKTGAAPSASDRVAPENIKRENLKVSQITAFFLRTKSRLETLKLQRDINTYSEEPMMAIIPGVVLSELWSSLGHVEKALRLISTAVLLASLISMLVALFLIFEIRRREMAVFRALGATRADLFALSAIQGFLLSVSGVLVGYLIHFLLFFIVQGYLERTVGLSVDIALISTSDFIFSFSIVLGGTMSSLIPAWKNSRQVLKDGLSYGR